MTRQTPQRIFHPGAPGALLKRATAATPRPAKSDSDSDAGYLALVRQCPCLHCGMEPCEAAHLRMASAAFGKASGLGKKPADRWALPLCAEHHRLARDAQHNRGEAEFWTELGINPLLACERLWAARGDLVRMVSVVHMVIAERSRV
jgi:hypothetical protein